jgi:hypothetical protein
MARPSVGDRQRAKLQRRAAAQLEAAPTLPGVEADPRPTWAAFSACFTPRAVVRQGLIRLLGLLRLRYHLPPGNVIHVLDVGAGGGVFGQVWRELESEGLTLPAYLTALEPRESEAANLERFYDLVIVGEASGFAALDLRVDLVIANPPWDLWGECLDAVWPTLDTGAIVAFLGPSQWGHSDEAADRADLFDRCRPIAQWRVRGRIAFTGGAGHPTKCSWWLFRRGVSDAPSCGPEDDLSWPTLTLPPLTPAERTWRLRPGTE